LRAEIHALPQRALEQKNHEPSAASFEAFSAHSQLPAGSVDLRPFGGGQSEKLEAATRGGCVPDNGDGAQRISRELNVDFDSVTDGGLRLDEGAEAAFTEIEADAVRSLQGSGGEVVHGEWNAEGDAKMTTRRPGYGRCRRFGAGDGLH
jgi:hypothetical protein